MLEQLTEPRLPPSQHYFPQLFPEKRPSSLSILHDFSSLVGPTDHVCVALDPEYAPFFPEAKWQPAQNHYCISGERGPLIPDGFKRFSKLSLVVLDESQNFHPWRYLNWLPLPPDANWEVEYGARSGSRHIENKGGIIEAYISIEHFYRDALRRHKQMVKVVTNTIEMVNTLVKSQ